MSDETMVALVQRALDERKIKDEVLAAGEFNPRGHSGGLFVGGLIAGGETSGMVDVGEGVGVNAGSLADIEMHAVDAASGLPETMLIGVSSRTVYGFAAQSPDDEPTNLVFALPRSGLTVNVHKRVYVRVIKLIDEASGSKIELEGNRLSLMHSKDHRSPRRLSSARWRRVRQPSRSGPPPGLMPPSLPEGGEQSPSMPQQRLCR